MKSSSFVSLTIGSLIFFNVGLSSFPVIAATSFTEQEVDPNSLIAVARPYGNGKYDLLVIEQLPVSTQCWREEGSNPVSIDPLLLNFDFTSICERSTDSNGYSIRVSGQDYGLDYLFRIVEQDGELLLVGSPRRDPSQPELVIGRTHGIKPGLLKISLNPGWRMTKRTFNGTPLHHIYFSTQNKDLAVSIPAPTTSSPINNTPNSPSGPVKEWKFTAPNSSSPSPKPLPPSYSSSVTPLPPSYSSSVTPLPPPPPENQRKTLSELLPLPSNSISSLPSNSTSSTSSVSVSVFRVIVIARNTQEEQKLKQIYPDSFSTSYQGRPVWQVGRFGNRTNAQFTIETLKNAGLNGEIVQ